MVPIVEKVSSRSLSRQEFRLESERLQYENALGKLELADRLRGRLEGFEAGEIERKLVNRLEVSEFLFTDMSVCPFGDRGEKARKREGAMPLRVGQLRR